MAPEGVSQTDGAEIGAISLQLVYDALGLLITAGLDEAEVACFAG